VFPGHVLKLNEDNGNVAIPHLNVRGNVTVISGENIVIRLSKKSSEFLNTRQVEVKTPKANERLLPDDEVFIKFISIDITGKQLKFKNIEIYKYTENIEKEVKGRVSWTVPNDFGGTITYTGTEFKYNDEKYVDPDTDYSEDGKYYFVDIYDGRLLIEEYKNMYFPMRWFNMINPQETYFDVIVKIYKEKENRL
jgi:hypothetical protein